MNREQLLKPAETRTVTVTIGGEDITIRSINARQWARINSDSKGDTKKRDALLVIASIVDESGSLLLSDKDIDALYDMDTERFEILRLHCLKINGMLTDIDEYIKN